MPNKLLKYSPHTRYADPAEALLDQLALLLRDDISPAAGNGIRRSEAGPATPEGLSALARYLLHRQSRLGTGTPALGASSPSWAISRALSIRAN